MADMTVGGYESVAVGYERGSKRFDGKTAGQTPEYAQFAVWQVGVKLTRDCDCLCGGG
jgi:hypothetical protein